jgi:hypothetical protein
MNPAGPNRANRRETLKTATRDTNAALISMIGKRDTSKFDRNMASRVALLAI